ncbi:UNVERIFIED_CONTAM: hypothetical protein Sradi_7000500 [Sesamum radiatum]|uniref:Uncharacterized protein n=1 Tax=Sesamum radiatum TaxID=300843 RepID=A0AAW2JD81_SESRA
MGQSQNSYPPKSHRTRGPGRNQSSPKPGARTGARKQALNSHSINRKATTDKLFEEEKEERKRTSLFDYSSLDFHSTRPASHIKGIHSGVLVDREEGQAGPQNGLRVRKSDFDWRKRWG